MHFLIALTLLTQPAHAGKKCKHADVQIADDADVLGVTGAWVVEHGTRSFQDIPIRWHFGGTTTISGTIAVEPGTARRVNRPDCVPACQTRYRLAMACPPDAVVLDAVAIVTTADGRLSEARFEGEAVGRAQGGSHWEFRGEFPWSEKVGGFTALELGKDDRHDPSAVRLWTGGAVEPTHSVSLDAASDGKNSTRTAALGGHPEHPIFAEIDRRDEALKEKP